MDYLILIFDYYCNYIFNVLLDFLIGLKSFVCTQLYGIKYVFTPPLHHVQGVTQGQFLSRVNLFWI